MARSKQRHKRLEAKRKRRQKRVARRAEKLESSGSESFATGFEPAWSGAHRPRRRRSSSRPVPKPHLLLELTITLIGTHPPIWRRIQVPDCTLGDLHAYVQSAMGWEDDHLHQFLVDGTRYGDPDVLTNPFRREPIRDEYTALLSSLLPADGSVLRIEYEYDFGDSWRHEIVLEQVHQVAEERPAAVCVAGQRACPPEDIGGIWGYQDLLEALADPQAHADDERMEWYEDFDPEEFDPDEVTRHWRQWA